MQTSNRGFTLLETVLTTALIGIVVSAVLGIVVFGYRSYIRIQDKSELQQHIRTAANRIQQSIRMMDLSQNHIRVDEYEITSGDRRYFLSNGVLYERIGWGTNQLANYIEVFKPELDGDMIHITIIASKNDIQAEIHLCYYIGWQ